MKSLYVTSIEPYSGKTAACLAVGKRLKSDGYCVKYVKPLSLQPWRVEGKLADEDTAFVKEALDLTGKPWELSPVVVTSDLLRKYLSGQGETNLLEKVKNVCEETIAGCDILLLEGGGSLREGYVMGLPTPLVATTLGSVVLLILKYSDEARLLDDVLASKARLGQALGGVIINRVPEEAMSFVTEMAVPYLEKQGIPVFGVLPEVRSLAALTVQELIDVLGAEVLTNTVNPEGVVENITVGAMTAEAALSHFRRQKNKAVITGGDRTEIQLAALETSTTCLILTGNLQPSSLIVRQADQSGVPVLLVRGTPGAGS
jgi:BioD-like phosphotransacetylase family protein